jgi:hypothetical protein
LKRANFSGRLIYLLLAVSGFVCGGCGGSSSITQAPPPPSGIIAARANDFLNTFGVNTHIGLGWDDPSQVAALVQQIGFRNLRDNNVVSFLPTFIAFSQQTGVKFDMGVVGPNGQADLTTSIQTWEQYAQAGILLAVEGPNEPPYWPVTWNGSTSSLTAEPYFTPVAEYQQALYAQVKADAALKSYPVWDVTLGGYEPNDVGLQFLQVPQNPPDAATLAVPAGTQYADYANVHNYDCPGTFIPNMMWDSENTSWTLAGQVCVVGLYWNYQNSADTANWTPRYAGYSASQVAALPRVITETGWREGQDGLTDAQIGGNYLDLFLDAFVDGWSYTFLYDLKDDGDNYGLVNSDYSLRPQATCLKNFTTILADHSSNFTPGSIAYSIPNEPATVHDLLLQKSDGTFDLAVWDEQIPGSGVSDSVTVNLGGTYTVSEYDATTGTSAIKTLTGVSTVTLTLTDHPVILQLSGS